MYEVMTELNTPEVIQYPTFDLWWEVSLYNYRND